MSEELRCRFAPSPTGFLHVGSAQSALFNWLFARGQGAQFLLRIEDTDAERNRPELTDNILEMLRWLGLEWDGEPVHQSDRVEEYKSAARRLAAEGNAYWCDCSPEAVQVRNKAAGGKPGYDGFCRERGLEGGPGTVLRFRSPRDGATGWTDLIRDDVRFENANIEDFVLLRSNGNPMFLLANVIDDAFMAITHVIRGEDHVNGTPKYLLLRDALGYTAPVTFAHLPLLVNEQRKKLSKRRDDVSVADYKARGYLPEAMRNYLSLLGWGPEDGVEIRPIAEIVAMFRLEDVNPSPAFFDLKKLDHINGAYIRALPLAEFVDRAGEYLPDRPGAREALVKLAPEVQERVKTLAEVAAHVDFLYLGDDEVVRDEAAWAKATKDPRSAPMLDETIDGLGRLAAEGEGAWTRDRIEAAVQAATVAAGFVNPEGHPQLSKAQGVVRVPVTGRGSGPPLWESIAALGPAHTLGRLQRARSAVG